MGDELRKKFNTKVDLIAGSGGEFEIEIAGKLVFSKRKEGRFPSCEDI